jgi:hypothetical protein
MIKTSLKKEACCVMQDVEFKWKKKLSEVERIHLFIIFILPGLTLFNLDDGLKKKDAI